MSRATLGSRDLRSHSVARTYTQPTFCTTTKKKVRKKIIIIKVRGKNTGKKNGKKYWGKNTGKSHVTSGFVSSGQACAMVRFSGSSSSNK